MTGLRFPKPVSRILDKRALRLERERQARQARAIVKKRDKGLCVVCGKRGGEVHHVVYRSLGGKDEPRNMVTLCKRDHEDVHAHLLRLIPTPRGWRCERVTARVPYGGAIDVGQRFIWEPDRPRARAEVVVTHIATHDSRGRQFDERRIWTRTVIGSVANPGGQVVWNEEGRFREACVPGSVR